MGWTYYRQPGETKQAQLKHLVAEIIKPTKGSEYSAETLKHCRRGNIVWRVVKLIRHEDRKEFRYIECNLLDYNKDSRQWGWKSIDEGMGPSYSSCPLGYLELAPTRMLPDDIANSDFDEGWRERVRMYHRKHQVGDLLILHDGYKIPELRVTNLKPLVGMYRGIYYRVPRDGIAKVIPAGESRKVA